MTELANAGDSRFLPDVAAIDLSLSGGGFRATLFHLGVISFLREKGLLSRVKVICSVSGGSILAAHLITYWPDYIGEEAAARQRMRHLVEPIMQEDLSGRVLAKSKNRLLELKSLNSELLVSEYRELLDSPECEVRRWDELEGRTDRPALHILATHLNTGRAGAFSTDGFNLLPVAAGARHEDEIKAFAAFAKANSIGHQDIARAVAASAAFPPVFSPISLIPHNPTHMLTDGGVYDNSGVNYLSHIYEKENWNAASNRLVIVSDAGREFPTELGPQYETLLALATRVTDTQADRIANSDSEAAAKFFSGRDVPLWRISIHDSIPIFDGRPENHTKRVQELLATIRTELDAFSAEEVFVLYRHGYLAAQAACAQYALQKGIPLSLNSVPWTPVDDGEDDPDSLASLKREELEERLKDGHLVKKLDTLPELVTTEILSTYRWRIGFAVSLALVLTAAIGFGGYLIGKGFRGQDVVQEEKPVVPKGALAIASAEVYRSEGWAASIPALNTALRSTETQYVYTFTTDPLSSLTKGAPHSEAVAQIALRESLGAAQVILFLEQTVADDGSQYVMLTDAGPRRLAAPPGRASDRIRGVVISETPIDQLEMTISEDIIIQLEAP